MVVNRLPTHFDQVTEVEIHQFNLLHTLRRRLARPCGTETGGVQVEGIEEVHPEHVRQGGAAVDRCKSGNENAPRVCLGGVRQSPAMTYSRAIRTTIGPGCLTAVFGMGTGVAIQVCSPGSTSPPLAASQLRKPQAALYQEGSGKSCLCTSP